MGRKLRVLFLTGGKCNELYPKVRKFFIDSGYKLVSEEKGLKLTFKAGSKLLTYAFGTWRWSRALRTLTVTFQRSKEGCNIELFYDVSWLVGISSIYKAARIELARFKKSLNAKQVLVSFK